MSQATPLFIMGNKRSGTSLLVTLLNLHPKVFVTNESDVAWILYQARNGPPPQYTCYPWDGPLGMEATLTTCRSILEYNLCTNPNKETITSTFFQVQEHLMKCGSAIQQPHQKTHVTWIGDKKPVQHCDPEIRPFLHTHFPNARYIHIVRDPRAVVASKIKVAKTWRQGVPSYWKAEPQDILERWALHEEWVLQAKSLHSSQIYTLRLEDLCKDPIKRVTELFNFIELEIPKGIAQHIFKTNNWNISPLYDIVRNSDIFPILRDPDRLALNLFVKPCPNREPEPFHFSVSPRVTQIMQVYGYA